MTIAYCRALVQVCCIPAAKDTYCQVSTTAWRKSETWMARTVFFAGSSAVSREIIVSRHFRHQRLMWHIAPVLRPMPGRGASWRGEESLDVQTPRALVLVGHHTATAEPQCVRMFWPEISLLIHI